MFTTINEALSYAREQVKQTGEIWCIVADCSMYVPKTYNEAITGMKAVLCCVMPSDIMREIWL